jgi:hypothetical protein
MVVFFQTIVAKKAPTFPPVADESQSNAPLPGDDAWIKIDNVSISFGS